jgi:hypothetical protein
MEAKRWLACYTVPSNAKDTRVSCRFNGRAMTFARMKAAHFF